MVHTGMRKFRLRGVEAKVIEIVVPLKELNNGRQGYQDEIW